MLFLCDSGHYPTASLILKTGQPVMRVDGSVVLRLANDEGLSGWNCYVFKEQRTRLITLKLGKNDRRSIEFQPNKLVDPETIFWCTNRNQTQRSNQVVIRTSGRCSIHADLGVIFHDELKCRVHFYPLWKFECSFGVITFPVVQHWLWFLSL